MLGSGGGVSVAGLQRYPISISSAITEDPRLGNEGGGGDRRPHPRTQHFWTPNIMFNNVTGLGIHRNRYNTGWNDLKIKTLRHLYNMMHNNTDIILLQETHHNPTYVLPANFTPMGKSFPINFHSCSDDNVSDGIICMAKQDISFLNESTQIIPGRLDYMRLKHKDYDNIVHVYNVYNYTSNNVNQSITLLDRLDLHITLGEYSADDTILIVGDININLSVSPALSPSRPLARLYELLEKFNLVDVLQELNHDSSTWRGEGLRNVSHSRLDAVFSNKPRIFNDVCMYSNPHSDHLIIALSKEKPSKTKSIQYHKNIFNQASFTEIATDKISTFLQLHSSDVTLTELRALDDPTLYGHLEGGVVHLLNPLLDTVKCAYIDSRILMKSSHYLAESKYQKCF